MFALVLAATVRVVVPSFDTDAAAPFVAARVTALTVQALRNGNCADVRGPAELGPEGQKDFEHCFGQYSCLAQQTRNVDAEFLLLGTVTKVADVHGAQLLVLDAASRRVVRSLRLKLPARLDQLAAAMQGAQEPLCRAVQALATPLAAGAELPIEDIALDDQVPRPELPEVASAPPPSAPATAPAPAETAPPAVAQTPRSAPEPAADPPPPPARASKPPAPKAALAPPPAPRHSPAVTTPALASFGASAALALGGALLGLGSRSIVASDQVTTLEGRTVHSITRDEAARANSYALGANVLFAGAVVAAGAGGFFVWQEASAETP